MIDKATYHRIYSTAYQHGYKAAQAEHMMTPDTRIMQITAPHFVAGLIIAGDDNRCVFAAPIIKRFIGKKAIEIASECDKKGWRAAYI